MNKNYEQMVKFNMSMVRYYADKCGTVGLYDVFDCNFKPLYLSEPDLNLWKLIAAFSDDNGFENFCIVPEQYANYKVNNYSAYQLEKYRQPILIFKRINNNNCDWQMLLEITKPILLCQYIDGVKYAYGLSAKGTPLQRVVMYTRGDDFDCFKRKYTEIEKQVESNFKELERYKLLKKKYEEKIKLMRMSDDF